MASSAPEITFPDTEQQRKALEDKIPRLRGLLQQWRLWAVEYEALREEVADARRPADLARIRRDFEGQLVNSREVAELLGRAGGADLKPAEQVLGLLDRRLDYVQRNIDTLERQLEQAEDHAADAATDEDRPGQEDAVLPIMDIVEELDDDDNVLSFRIQKPGDTEAKVSEALKKAGVEIRQDQGGDSSEDEAAAKSQPPPVESTTNKTETPQPATRPAATASAAAPKATTSVKSQSPTVTNREDAPAAAAAAAAKKAVSFTQDTKPAVDGSAQATQPRTAQAQRRIDEIMREAKEQENFGSSPPVIPDGEAEEDAELRRDMLAYSMNEIGPVVAELELEEGYSDDEEMEEGYEYNDDEDEDEYDDDYDDEDDDDDDDEEEDEDERGRSRRSALSPAYRRRMLELEKKLGVGRQDAAASRDVTSQAKIVEYGNQAGNDPEEPRMGRIKISPNPAIRPKPAAATTDTDTAIATASAAIKTSPSSKAKGGKKKGVRFAEEIDIADETAVAAAPAAPKERTVEPLSDIVERVPPGPGQAPSRFLETMEPNFAPSGPEGKTIAEAVVEREPVAKAREPSELDADLLHQEAAVEYHRVRNKMIQKDGGFLREKESAIEPLDESEGGPKRMSRFKAARLGRA